ncbi:MAG TPA: hypothetical protein VL550_00335 [Rhodocyclaceae bacterium]|nr:hypothetical protein [Rhodocyclaceae bacterium]
MKAHDQAAGLRQLFNVRSARVVSLTASTIVRSRSQLVVGAAAQLASRGHRVLVLDENPAPDNASRLLLDAAFPDMLQVVRAEVSLEQAVYRVNRNLSVLGAARLVNAGLPFTRRIADIFQMLVDGHDLILIDASVARAGSASALALQGELIIAVKAESAGIMQAYTQIKKLAQQHHRNRFRILVSGMIGRDEARVVFNNLRKVAAEHLGVQLDYLGLAEPERGDMLADLLDAGLGREGVDPREFSGMAAALGLASEQASRHSMV